LNQDGSRNGGCSIDPRQNVLHAYAQAPGKLAMAHELCSLADDALFFLFLFRHGGILFVPRGANPGDCSAQRIAKNRSITKARSRWVICSFAATLDPG